MRTRPMEPAAIRTVLGGRVRTIESLDPTTTVLQYLRRNECRTGTKDGCAQGGCGACTVALGVLEGDRIRYRAVNACLTPILALDGKQLVTIEDLAYAGALHPIQKAFVEAHASQCGFCTPGFVMALFAQRDSGDDGPAAHERAISGNLCRCSGYRSIKEAALRSEALPDPFRADERAAVRALRSLRRRESFELRTPDRRVAMPTSLADLLAVVRARPRARVLAGATDVLLEPALGRGLPDSAIWIGAVPELRRIRRRGRRLEVGAAATLADIELALKNVAPSLCHVFDQFASPQVRNVATLAGNIATASPVADGGTLAIALDGELVLRTASDERRVSVADFLASGRADRMRRGEIIERIVLSLGPKKRWFRFYKVGRRAGHDTGVVSAALGIDVAARRVRDVRLCFAGVGHVARRARRAEDVLRGRPLNEETIGAAADLLRTDLGTGTAARGTAQPLRLAAALLRRFAREYATTGGRS